jgi:signal transduction histidine kinase
LSRIAAESARLARLVGDLLDSSAIESGVMRLQRDWCDIPLVVDAATACLAPGEAASVRVEKDPDLPVVFADHDRLEQVLVNLMENAFRHNPPGRTVVVGIHRSGASDVAISVRDDGDGIPEEIASNPFEPGRRRASPTAGTGLGLSIAKGIVDAHAGTLVLEPGRPGATFRITLPVESPEAPADDTAAEARAAGALDGRAEGVVEARAAGGSGAPVRHVGDREAGTDG